VQNLRRGHYELTTDRPARDRVCAAFGELSHYKWSQLQDGIAAGLATGPEGETVDGAPTHSHQVCARIHRADDRTCSSGYLDGFARDDVAYD